ncbi:MULTISPECIES: PqqD family protein [unclassified Mesorhizobium]|uniref:PqqD family protein n=1 Tax=unclassified Mesorhizobium TaxID=325217 RepID=UPI001094121D|nr:MULTISPECIES: PqqD family protein [unclassified Mesorhizobium]TGQ72913.1 PqqD family protein [bacterium M00.F.Ca.ET.205.01.1.1]TGU53670.1 PqqD family protein [bacterium M00.F.Ca.ET.152.01.1.1]TGV37168.1 PqqD family protein [Mesorhizobium sp. M00.F.Ca.ET.186.01.1.1]TGZ39463.1 PqqD family protein [bacterium M00.F.Ca.ET.162.01.1.1]TGT92080.1 PqqD family protein [Mesorhizobium sp. M8A.F.Ca.ET.161.01.1.1]
MKKVEPDTVLQPTEWCVARPRKDGHLFYNSRTDEMHLVPPTGVLVFHLCDGLRSVNEIEDELAGALDSDRVAVHGALTEFLDKLVTRGIVEPVHAQ